MPSKPETYPAIYIIFTLLNALRRGIERKNIWREFRRQKIALQPRLAFWVAVCRQAGLVREDMQDMRYELRVTSYARVWVGKSPEEQAVDLIEAWQNAPRNSRVRQFRRRLLWKLRHDQPLTQKDKGALHGLEALGLVAEGKLTKWGEYFIQGKGSLPSPKAIEPCKLQEEQFAASVPDHADFLWELERFLRPKSPGVYPLPKRALRYSLQSRDSALQFHDDDPNKLIELLERGLGGTLPGQTKALILKQPSIRVMEGIVLEFSSPVELKQLRRQPVFRKYMDEFLSPQRVLVSHEKASRLFQMLRRRGIYACWNEEQPETRKKRTHYISPSKALLSPVGKSIPKLALIEKYQQLGQALDVLYRAPGCAAEKRRIIPLFIEERGGHTYVIAHCQTRRAQRTFRLDRMEIPGTW